MDKIQLRKKIRAALNEMQTSEYEQSSLTICEQLLKEPSIIEGETIAVTISRKTEVDTTMIIERLWALGKTVVVPKCHPADRSMTFHKIESFKQLETVYMDLKEPIESQTEFIEANNIDVIIVPGIVFDCHGYRIGYGGGYYDRFLKQYTGILLSLAFHRQLIDRVPKEDHDVPVHFIITEKEQINCTSH